MDKEELARRIGVERADWKLQGGRGPNGALRENMLGVQAWAGSWCDGVRIPLRVPSQVAESEWQAAIDALKARKP